MSLVPKIEYHSQYFDIHTKNKDKKLAFCPYCIDGFIVQDRYSKDIFFCRLCNKRVYIPEFDG